MKHIRSIRIIFAIVIIALGFIIALYLYIHQQPNSYSSLSELEENEFAHSDIIYEQIAVPEPYICYAIIDTKLHVLSFLIVESKQNAFVVIDRTQKSTIPLSGTLKKHFGSITFSCNTSNDDATSFSHVLSIGDYIFCYSVQN